MANYNVVVGNRFEPFSFDRYFKPYQEYGKAYDALEAVLSDLSTKSEMLRRVANEDPNSEAALLFNKYSEDLENLVDKFSREGLNIKNRKGILDLWRRYSSEIDPIDKAHALKLEDIKAFDTNMQKDPTYITNWDPRSISLDEYMSGAYTKLNRLGVSGAGVEADTNARALKLALQIINDPEVSPILYDQKFEIYRKNGYTEEAFNQLALDNFKGNKDIQLLIQQEREAANYEQYDDVGKLKIDEAIYRGLRGLVLPPTIEVAENRRYETPLLRIQRQSYLDEHSLFRIANGLDPYGTDAEGNKYFSDGSLTWKTDKDGNIIDGSTQFVDPKKDGGSGTINIWGVDPDLPILNYLSPISGYWYDKDLFATAPAALYGAAWNEDSENFEISKDKPSIDKRDLKDIDYTLLSANQLLKLKEELSKKYGVGIEDVVIKKDRDIFTRNEYVIEFKQNMPGEMNKVHNDLSIAIDRYHDLAKQITDKFDIKELENDSPEIIEMKRNINKFLNENNVTWLKEFFSLATSYSALRETKDILEKSVLELNALLQNN